MGPFDGFERNLSVRKLDESASHARDHFDRSNGRASDDLGAAFGDATSGAVKS